MRSKQIQSGKSILLQKVENGPVTNSSSPKTPTFSVVNQSSGLPQGTVTVYDPTGGDSSKIEGGDILVLSGLSTVVGTKYTVQMVVGGSTVGSCTYTVQS